MKNTILALVAVVASAPAAAIPDVVGYAARVENDAGPFDGTVSVAFQLFDAPTGGALLWSENVASLVVIDGDLVHDLGSVEPLDDSVLARDDVFLAVTLNGDTLSPRAPIRAVPFALKARDAETLGGLSADDVATDAELAGLNFGNLPGVPAAFADGVDNDTVATVAAGGGLKVAANAFSIDVNGVTLERLADNSVNSNKVVDGSIQGSDIKDGSVANVDIATNAVTSDKIASGTIVEADLSGSTTTLFEVTSGGCTVPAGTIQLSSNCTRSSSGCPSGQLRSCSVTGACTADVASPTCFGNTGTRSLGKLVFK